jgi:hypothetical protein
VKEDAKAECPHNVPTWRRDCLMEEGASHLIARAGGTFLPLLRSLSRIADRARACRETRIDHEGRPREIKRALLHIRGQCAIRCGRCSVLRAEIWHTTYRNVPSPTPRIVHASTSDCLFGSGSPLCRERVTFALVQYYHGAIRGRLVSAPASGETLCPSATGFLGRSCFI